MSRRSFRIALFVAAALAPVTVHAGGFELYEHSPRAVGTAGAQSAQADDPSAIFYNPAGLTMQRGFGLLGGVNIIHPEIQTKVGMQTFESPSTAVAPTVFIAQRIGPHFAVGIGLFSQFALDIDWGRDKFPGRFIGTSIQLITATVNPTVAIRPIPRLSIGFGVDIAPSSAEIRRNLSFGGPEGELHFGASAVGVGGNIGVLVQAIKNDYLNIGVSYRSAMDLDFNGHASLSVPPELFSRVYPTGPHLLDATTTVTLPHNFTFALATRPTPHLSITTDVHLTLWSALDRLQLTITDPKAPAGTKPQQQALPLQWTNAVTVRLAAEYRLLAERLALRLGFGWDQTPVPTNTLSPLAPDADRWLVSAGIGWRQGGLGIDAGYMAVILPSRTSTNPELIATYETLAHVIGVGFTIRAEELFGRLNEPAYK
jgi:long-chain fatty acid transport protein